MPKVKFKRPRLEDDKCHHCEERLDEVKTIPVPQEAKEENLILQEKNFEIEGADPEDKPQFQLTDFYIYDRKGHLVSLFLIEEKQNEKDFYFHGKVHTIGSEEMFLVKAKLKGLYINHMDESLILETELAEYYISDPAPEYRQFFENYKQAANLVSAITNRCEIAFLEAEELSYEQLIQQLIKESGDNVDVEEVIANNLSFICTHLASMEADGSGVESEDSIPLSWDSVAAAQELFRRQEEDTFDTEDYRSLPDSEEVSPVRKGRSKNRIVSSPEDSGSSEPSSQECSFFDDEGDLHFNTPCISFFFQKVANNEVEGESDKDQSSVIETVMKEVEKVKIVQEKDEEGKAGPSHSKQTARRAMDSGDRSSNNTTEKTADSEWKNAIGKGTMNSEDKEIEQRDDKEANKASGLKGNMRKASGSDIKEVQEKVARKSEKGFVFHDSFVTEKGEFKPGDYVEITCEKQSGFGHVIDLRTNVRGEKLVHVQDMALNNTIASTFHHKDEHQIFKTYMCAFLPVKYFSPTKIEYRKVDPEEWRNKDFTKDLIHSSDSSRFWSQYYDHETGRFQYPSQKQIEPNCFCNELPWVYRFLQHNLDISPDKINVGDFEIVRGSLVYLTDNAAKDLGIEYKYCEKTELPDSIWRTREDEKVFNPRGNPFNPFIVAQVIYWGIIEDEQGTVGKSCPETGKPIADEKLSTVGKSSPLKGKQKPEGKSCRDTEKPTADEGNNAESAETSSTDGDSSDKVEKIHLRIFPRPENTVDPAAKRAPLSKLYLNNHDDMMVLLNDKDAGEESISFEDVLVTECRPTVAYGKNEEELIAWCHEDVHRFYVMQKYTQGGEFKKLKTKEAQKRYLKMLPETDQEKKREEKPLATQENVPALVTSPQDTVTPMETQDVGTPMETQDMGEPAATQGEVEPMETQEEVKPLATLDEVKPLATLDIYAGAGGLSTGLEESGAVKVKWAVEFDAAAAKAFELNHSGCRVICSDTNIALQRLVNKSDGWMKDTRHSLPEPGEVECIIGGPPCQGFSRLNNNRKGDYSKAKNSQISTFLSYVEYYRPRFVLMENVTNFVNEDDCVYHETSIHSLVFLGYQVDNVILQAGHYGVAQNRSRFFLLAAAPGERLPTWPEPEHAFDMGGRRNPQLYNDIERNATVAKKFYTSGLVQPGAPRRMLTTWDVIGDLQHMRTDRTESTYMDNDDISPVTKHYFRSDGSDILYDHVYSCSSLDKERIRRLPTHPGADWRDLPNEAVTVEDSVYEALTFQSYYNPKTKEYVKGLCPCVVTGSKADCDEQKQQQERTFIPFFLAHSHMRGDKRYEGTIGRVPWDGIFQTTLTKLTLLGKLGSVIHPEKSRILTVRESARSQGFRDNFRFYGRIDEQYMQIGNAVPPPLARAIGVQIKKCLKPPPRAIGVQIKKCLKPPQPSREQ